MSPRRIALALCCSLIAGPLAATELLLPGDYHGDEVTARDREIWLTLVLDAEGQTRLEPRPIEIENFTADARTTLESSPADGARLICPGAVPPVPRST